MAVIGKERFAEFLAGFHVVDEHFRTAPLEANAPVLLGLIGLWYNEFFGARNPCGAAVFERPVAVRGLPAAADDGVQRQVGARRRHTGDARAPAKSSGANREPTASTRSTNCCIRAPGWCPPTSSGSRQPTDDLPTADGTGSMHDLLMSNFFAQTQVLAFGKTAEEIAAEGTPPTSSRTR